MAAKPINTTCQVDLPAQMDCEQSPFLSKTQSHNPQSSKTQSKEDKSRLRSKRQTSITSECFRDSIQIILEHYYKDDRTKFLKRALNFIENDWENVKENMIVRLSTIKLAKETLKYRSYSYLQKEMISQWKNNKLLNGIHILWNHTLTVDLFHDIDELTHFYQSFRNVIAQALHQLFKDSFSKQCGDILNNIHSETAVYIITRNSEWGLIYNKYLQPLVTSKKLQIKQNYPYEQININPAILDVRSNEPQFENTKQILQKFIKEKKIKKKIQLLESYRKELLRETSVNIEKNQGGSLATFKDQTLSCLEYIIVKYHLAELGQALDYLSFTLGDQMTSVLRAKNVASFRDDLYAVFQFVTISEPSPRKSRMSELKPQKSSSTVDKELLLARSATLDSNQGQSTVS